MKGKMYNSQMDAFRTIWSTEGMRGFYRGWSANTIKVGGEGIGGHRITGHNITGHKSLDTYLLDTE